MMRVTIKIEIKKHVSKYGFIRNGNDYYRLVNDLLQGFYIKERHVMGVVAYDIRFGMFPLCKELSSRDSIKMNTAYAALFDITDIWQLYPPKGYLIMYEFHYSPEDPDSVSICLEKMIRAIDNYLIPYFDRYDSCAALYADKTDVLCRGGVFDYHVALATGDTESAIKFLRSQIEVCIEQEKEYRELVKKGRTPEDRDYLVRMEECKKDYWEKINYLNSTSVDEYFKRIKEIEDDNLKILFVKRS